MSDYRSNVDNPPPRRVAVSIKTGRIGTDELFPQSNVVGHNKDEQGDRGPVKFVRLNDNVGRPLIENEDYVKAVKLLVRKEGLSEGVYTDGAEAQFRANFIKNSSQILIDHGDSTKADQLFKMGYEMLMEHYKGKENGASPLAAIEGMLEANKEKVLPSGKVDTGWFDDMLGITPKI